MGATWGADDSILFARPDGIWQLPGAGGTAERLIAVEDGESVYGPQMLPGGQVVLYTVGRVSGRGGAGAGGGGQWDEAQIVVEQVATGDRTVVVEGGSDAHYLPTGHLVYALGTTLLAVPFDLDLLQVVGSPVPVVEGVSRATWNGAANADVAASGALVYVQDEGRTARTLVWVDRNGTEEAVAVPPRDFGNPRISPDGTRVLLDARDEEDDIWIWDLRRETLTRMTSALETDWYPVWTPDGQRIVFASRMGGQLNVHWRAADGTDGIERLIETPRYTVPESFSPDGRRLVFHQSSPDNGFDLHVATLDDERRVEPLIVTEFMERNAEVSPDGRWLAYQSDESGQYEVYVRPFPEVDQGRWPISTIGGTRPLWGRDGKELFYMTNAGLMGVAVDTASGFEASSPTLVVSGSYLGSASWVGRSYDIAPDGRRFLMIKKGGEANPDDPLAGLTQIQVVLNWTQSCSNGCRFRRLTAT